jgi:hypothetical protein
MEEELMNIQIEKEPFTTTRYHAGTYTTPEGKEYEFTVAVADSDVQDTYMLELSWVDDNPNVPEVTDDIWENWSEYINKEEV